MVIDEDEVWIKRECRKRRAKTEFPVSFKRLLGHSESSFFGLVSTNEAGLMNEHTGRNATQSAELLVANTSLI